MRRLRAAGLDVRVGVLEAECREQHRGFLSVVQRGRPFVMLKLASSLDGRIATSRGESRWITGPEARAVVHRLRAQVDGLVVGSGTGNADDPDLTARRGDRVVHRPVRVLVDGNLCVGAGARIFRGEGAEAWVLCSRASEKARRRALIRAGVRLIDVPRRGRHLDLGRAMAQLAENGLTEVLVEGGAGLAAAMLRGGLVDELHWFIAPKLIGSEGIPALGEQRLRALADALELSDVKMRRVGKDLYVRGAVPQQRAAIRSRR
jgi:diaminohydroxyphosphoribosylaminopyrimidine deaminase/5-amino-6-(5-phosphoribosylamino)uracil reductase